MQNRKFTRSEAVVGLQINKRVNIEWGWGDGLIQVPLLTGQPSIDVELFENNALSTPGRTVGCGT